MLTEELARRFGAKLREIEPLPGQRLPGPMSDLLRAIAQGEQPHSGETDENGSRTDSEQTAGK
jgi:hypothetical protein